jgi:aspartyl-tRNA(Asn)/glutamyl-tRNA(Gln) amidotransferase subunit C
VANEATLTLDDVRAIAELAKLQLSEDELAAYATQLSKILGYFTLLQEVDTSHIAPTASVLPQTTVLRADVQKSPLTAQEVIANAPDSEDNQFKVNVVLGDE